MRLIALLTIVFLAACGPSADSETHWGDNDGNNTGENNSTGENSGPNNSNSNNDDNSLNGGNSSEPEVGLQLFMNPNFQDVAVGDSETRTLTLFNDEFGIVTIDEIIFEGDDFSADPPLQDWPEQFDNGEEFDVEITYEPTTEVEQFGAISVNWNPAGEAEEYASELTLSGNRACMDVDPATLIFSDIDVGGSKVLSVEVTNCGGVSFFEISPSVYHAGGDPDADDIFSIVNEGDFPHQLLPGDSIEIDVEYQPFESFEPSDAWYRLEIETDSSASQNVTLRNENDSSYDDCEVVNDHEEANDHEELNDENGMSSGDNGDNLNDNNWNQNGGENGWSGGDYCPPGDNAMNDTSNDVNLNDDNVDCEDGYRYDSSTNECVEDSNGYEENSAHNGTSWNDDDGDD